MAKREDLTPISYWRIIQVSGYTRKDGRRVQPYLSRTWVVAFPVAKEELDLSDFGREKFPPRPTRPTTEYQEEAHRSEWITVADYVLGLYEEYDYFYLEDSIMRRDEQRDFINLIDAFVWEKRLTSRSMKSLGLEEIYLIRAWVLMYNRTRDEYFIFSRCRSLLLQDEYVRESLQGAYDQVRAIYDDLVKWAAEDTDYLEVRRLAAWTVWGRPIGSETPEKAPKRS